MNRKRVDAAGELVGKCLVYHAVALDPALPFERRRYDMHPVMGLAARAVPRVPGMHARLVGDIEMRRGKCPVELFDHAILPRHAARLAADMTRRQRCSDRLIAVESGCQVLRSALAPSHNDRS